MNIGKDKIIVLVRKPLTKIITRLVGYGLVVLFGSFSIEASETEASAKAIGSGIASIVILFASAAIDWWHHKQDIKEEPKE